MWVFAVLIVLAMAGIALLAAGHGEPMQPAYDDRPDARVPQDRPIAPDDLRRVRFSLALRGYRMSEVDALLARLAYEQELRAAEQAEQERHHRAPDQTDAPGTDPPFPVLPPRPPTA
ncbi:DivIVA domain-containing protein [Nocardioides immobilis]|uniref:DivIVA domain-containing protein n=2 Tax=Nocardioides immobilis TaxID=2049295 RepID=A0A417Y6E9_9ACTN|nr:DivIVA domain-containing protein [Nocardioides immobilis]